MHVTVLSHRAKRNRTTAATVTTSAVMSAAIAIPNQLNCFHPSFMKKDATTFERHSDVFAAPPDWTCFGRESSAANKRNSGHTQRHGG